MKQRHLWLAVPLVMLLTACGTVTHNSQTSNKPTMSNASASDQVGNTASTPANRVANSGINKGTDASTVHTLSTQVYVTAQRYTTESQNVVYPQLHGLPSASVQQSLNTLLQKTSIYVPTGSYTKPNSYTYASSYNVVFEQGDIMNIVYSSGVRL